MDAENLITWCMMVQKGELYLTMTSATEARVTDARQFIKN